MAIVLTLASATMEAAMLKDDKTRVNMAQFLMTEPPEEYTEPMTNETFKALCEFLPNQEDRAFSLD